MKNFLALPNLVDLRHQLPKKQDYPARNKKISTRVWHHSLTLSHLTGSDAASFAKYHMDVNGWPGVAYAIVVEPKNRVQTPRGKRARIVWAHDFDRRTYHAGNANDYGLGICVAGDYRNERMQDYVKETINELQAALVADGIGREDKSHHEMPGYGWKACCVFDYKGAFNFLDQKSLVKAVPATYVIQEGDTFWNIANNMDGIRVADLLAANPGINANALQIGQVIRLGDAKGAALKTSAKTKPSSVPEKQLAMKEFVLLPKTVAAWKTYPLGVAPVAKNSDWSLAPARFGGLEYEILGRPQTDVVMILTGRGKRNIYVAASTGAKIYLKS
ncbi:LysM peptidoglycan-binding domain-containing protein [Planococcus beigongshangi]|uniref:LysM peptidoglycan-binding domain-containing protein n=1 Tax=Planococcus beigongshangi TaxID=2782536 RepID=UPI00193BF88A|nr:LysM peptidoglycan-binding domain-containing protein [Planococcus beigongshangi]